MPAENEDHNPTLEGGDWSRTITVDTSVVTPLQLDPLGRALEDRVTTAFGWGYQRFEFGIRLSSAESGTVITSEPFLSRWLSLPGGVQSYLSRPVSGDESSPAAGVLYFERGMIVLVGEQTHVVQGAIYLRYRALNDVSGRLGLPLADEEDAGVGGRKSRFENGTISWHGDTGAHATFGAIHARWQALGGANGLLGFPLTDELPVLRDGATIGQATRFQNGTIYWSQSTGAWEVYGAIRQCWEDEYGGASGAFGFPISGETSTPSSGGRYSNFEHGVLVWHPGGGYAGVRPFFSLRFYLDRVGSSGGEGFLDLEQDVYLQVRLSASSGERYEGRLPEAPDTDFGPDEEIDRVLIEVPVVRGDLIVDVSIEGWDRDWSVIPPDHDPDLLGTIEGHYTIDNLWGSMEAPERWSGPFMAAYAMQAPSPVNPGRFRQECSWSFVNQGTPTLSDHQYAMTFNDVGEVEDVWLHPFNRAYYELFFRGIAAGGNCFGMCVESIYAQVGRSVFAEPIIRFPGDATTYNEINMKQGYQLGASVIDYVIGQFLTGQSHDPVAAFQRSRELHARGDYPSLTLTRDLVFGPAHAVRPYAWDTSDPGRWIMKIADPNKPATISPDDNAVENCIFVYPQENRFEYQFQGEDWWRGDAWLGGRMIPIPYSAFADQPRTPFWEVFALVVGLSLILVGSAGRTEQISDDAGRTLYGSDADPSVLRWSDLRRDGGRLTNVSPVPLLASTASGRTPELFGIRGPVGRLDHRVTAEAGGAYEWALASPHLSAVLRGPGGGVADVVRVEQLGAGAPRLALTGNGKARAMALSLSGGSRQIGQQRSFDLGELAFDGRELRLSLADGGQAVVIENRGPDFMFTLDGRADPVSTDSLGARSIELEAGKVAKISPADWSAASLRKVPIEVEVSDHIDAPTHKKFQV